MRKLLPYRLLPCLLIVAALPARAGDAWLAPPPGVAEAGLAQNAAHAAPASGLRIVVIGADRRFAVIDGRTVRKGSEFNGARVVDIQADAVQLSRDGQIEQLRSTPAVVKKVHNSNAKTGSSGRQRGDKP